MSSYLTTAERETAERFPKDTAGHVLTVLHDDGLYRHLRCAQPDHSIFWFEVITWPGSLAIRGDMGGGYVFSRIRDMFAFFRSDQGRINPTYWAEKLPDCGRSVKEYSEDVLKAEIASHLAEYEKDYPDRAAEYERAKAEYDSLPAFQRWSHLQTVREPVKPKSPDEIRERIADYDADGELGFEEGARRLLSELEDAGVVSDTFEWDLSDWDWSFLWACHAIVWAVAQYDSARVETVTPAGGAR